VGDRARAQNSKQNFFNRERSEMSEMSEMSEKREPFRSLSDLRSESIDCNQLNEGI